MDEFYNNWKNIFVKQLESFWSINNPQDQIWVIKYKNEIIQLPSKKSSWKKIGHAKNALRNAILSEIFDTDAGYVYKKVDYSVFLQQKEKAYQDLLNSGDIEFVNLLEEK